MPSAIIIDGQKLATRIKREAAEMVRELATDGISVSLDAVMVGDPAAGEIYARSQRKRCEEVGIEYRLHTLPAKSTEAEIAALIRTLNADSRVTGILLHLPLPEGIDASTVNADLKDGVLTVTLHKKPEAQPKKIAVQTPAKKS